MNFVGCAHGNGAFVDDHFVVGHVLADAARCGQHILQIGRAVFVGWRAHTNELNGAMGHRCGHIGGELQTAGFFVALDQGFEPRLVDGNAAFVQDANLVGIHIQAHHMVAHFR